MVETMTATLFRYVLRSLRDIARLGLPDARLKWGIKPPSLWWGFDGEDISWFLDQYINKRGPAIDRLRKDFEYAMRNPTNKEGEVCLYFFPFNKRQAKAILLDIRG